jgi:hypothetical protein
MTLIITTLNTMKTRYGVRATGARVIRMSGLYPVVFLFIYDVDGRILVYFLSFSATLMRAFPHSQWL